ncbi:hypothetical protein [Wolbachia endosymbiont of Folsomia candida]|uniref:hypothetical protein n=1 Tax=Wolbachia endosymbiont of Folsomia candida TaxID=169402 RepID=UPI000A599171|nr:hypothetical protein [Wolbachia endosymbiont of Folsomia candida]APR97782.1 hypothetical protein ASM33_00270 [Wolbachia endosymbiont of Folsomia candida]
MIWNPFRIFSKKKQGNKDITEKNEEYNKQAKKAHKLNNSVAGIIAGNRPSERATRGTSQKTEISNLIERFTKLSETVEIMEIEGKHSKASIDALKEQINAVQTIGKEFSSSLKASTDLPFNMVNMPQKQSSLREEVGKLKQENRALDKLERKGKGEKKYIDTRRTLNNKKIAIGEKKISENDVKIKDFGKGEKVQELSENIKNNLIEFKREVSKLETMVKSIEKGQAPKPPKSIVSKPVVELQPVRVAPPPPVTTAQKLFEALKEFEEQRQKKGIVNQSTGELRRVKITPESPKSIKVYLQTLAEGVEISGVYEGSIDGKYEGSKEYLLRAVDDLKYFKLINDDKSMKIQETVNNPKLTKEEFIRTIKTLIETIDMDIDSKVSKAKQKDAGDHAQRIQKERDAKGKETNTGTEKTYRL